MKVLFQGDSITDWGRDYRNYHNMGNGYAKYAAEMVKAAHPDVDFEFINFGIGGNRTDQLFDRFYNDAIIFQPDVISILVGINDILHKYEKENITTTREQTAANYRAILERVKNETNAKIIMFAPFLLDAPAVAHIHKDLETLTPIVKGLADEYADAFIPLNEIFDEALKTQPEPLYYSHDGIHPSDAGAKLIAEKYFEAFESIYNK